MKLLKFVLPAVLLIGSNIAYADAPLKIGVLDVQQVEQQSPLVQSINKDLSVTFQPRLQKILATQKDVQAEMDNLNKNSAVMSADDKTKLQDKIIADRANFQAMVQSYQQDLTNARNQAEQKFGGILQTAVSNVAKQGQYTIIIQRADVPYFDPSVDVTAQVLKAMPSK